MLALTRKNQIHEIILEQKSVTVSELAKKFSVTEETIRRDLKALEEAGVLTRTYGGAYIQNGVVNEIQLSIRETALVPNKQTIAKRCAGFIHNGDTIALDASTTAFHICDEIKNKRLTVLTDSLHIVNMLAEYGNIRLICTGGNYQDTYSSFMGDTAKQTICSYFVDKAFVSCRSVDMEHGATDSSEEIAAIRKLYIERANQVYLIADHTKFNKVSFVGLCGFDGITAVVSDEPLPDEWHTFLEQRDIACHDGSE